MSTYVEQSAGPSWRKRITEDITLDIKELKRPRLYHYRLESESSNLGSDDGTESILSVQDAETDVVRDTTDTESKASDNEYDVEFEYEVASLSENEGSEVSTTDSDVSDSMMLAAAAAVICDSTLEAWITDVEDSDSSSDETSFGRSDFSNCVQCKGENHNPMFRYCDRCFQERKKFFPPRPRRTRKRVRNQPTPTLRKEAVKLKTLRNCLEGLSQDSGMGSGQECPSLGLDQIVVPDHLQTSGTSKSEDMSPTRSKSLESVPEVTESDSTESKPSIGTPATSTRRKRESSESDLSDYKPKKAKIVQKSTPEQSTSDLGSEMGCSSFASTISMSSLTSGYNSGSSMAQSSSFCSDKSENELCIICRSAPKNSIFLHGNLGHQCCCYPCAKKTLKLQKRCPVCNVSANKVVKVFTL